MDLELVNVAHHELREVQPLLVVSCEGEVQEHRIEDSPDGQEEFRRHDLPLGELLLGDDDALVGLKIDEEVRPQQFVVGLIILGKHETVSLSVVVDHHFWEESIVVHHALGDPGD